MLACAGAEISNVMLQTKGLAQDIPGVTLNWTHVISTKATHQMPELAVAKADVRTTGPGAEQKRDAALQAKLASSKLVPDAVTTAVLTRAG